MHSNETTLLAISAICGFTFVILIIHWFFGCAKYFLKQTVDREPKILIVKKNSPVILFNHPGIDSNSRTVF